MWIKLTNFTDVLVNTDNIDYVYPAPKVGSIVVFHGRDQQKGVFVSETLDEIEAIIMEGGINNV